MWSKLRPRSFYDVLAAIGCFAALTTGGAYAANTIGSSDVIDESLQSADLKNGDVRNSDLANDAVGTGKIADRNVTNPDIATSAVTGDKVSADTLMGGDIVESSLGKVGDADTLDGKDSAAFVGECEPGSVAGFVTVTGSPTFQTTPSSANLTGAYNCTGEPVRAVRQANGRYAVVFDGQEDMEGVATGNVVGPNRYLGASETVEVGTATGFPVPTSGYVINLTDSAGMPVDGKFVISVSAQPAP